MPEKKPPHPFHPHVVNGLKTAAASASKAAAKSARKSQRKGDVLGNLLMSLAAGTLQSIAKGPAAPDLQLPDRSPPKRSQNVVGHTTVTVDGVPHVAEILDPEED